MRTASSKRLELDYSNVLIAIFELMLRAGVRARDLLPVCVRALERAEKKAHTGRNEDSGGLVIAALVLDAWHRDRRYLTTAGAPKAVRLLGPNPSVEALVRRQRASQDPVETAMRLKAVRLVVPCGRAMYKPASDAAVISSRDPLVLQHAARALSTLVETVGKNVSGARQVAPLIERFAEVPDLPKKHVKAFQAFTHVQGRTFLRTVNDWLESRRLGRSLGKKSNGTVRAGIHTYAYVVAKSGRDTSIGARR
jgi:hypothetical protein